jgi:hypothetical protein
MEYQQFVVYCHWTNYQSPHHSRRRNDDDESLQRGLRERARVDRIATRLAWRTVIDRLLAAILRTPRVAA